MSSAVESAFPSKAFPEPTNVSLVSDLRFRTTYRPDIDGLRAIAIIPVVIFHAFPEVMRGGFVGVDIFFVISGFLISSVILKALQRGTFSFSGFYWNRINRIFPALLVVLAACFVFGWFFSLPDEYTQLGKHIVGATAYVENILLKREAGYFDIQSYLKPLTHVWSLSIEEQFYLTYPLLLWLTWRFRRNPTPVLLLLVLASFSLNIREIHHDAIGNFFMPQTRCWELMVGCALACWQLSKRESDPYPGMRWVAHFRSSAALQIPTAIIDNAFSVVGLLLVTIAVFRVRESVPFPGWWALLPVCGAALIILGGPAAWINRRILANRPMMSVGLISYPLYLWHWPILTFPRIIRGGEITVVARVLAIVLGVGLAWATWRYVERPIRFGRKTWLKPAALIALSVVLGSLGYYTYRQNGFVGRFPNLPNDLGRPQQYAWSTPDCRSRVGLAEISYCRSIRPEDPAVLLLGDSHAGSLYESFAAAFEERSQLAMNLGEAGCVPFYDTESYSLGVSGPDGCKQVVNRILQFATTSTSVQTIILSFRGPFNMSGHDFGRLDDGQVAIKLRWEKAPSNSSQADTFTDAMTETVSRLYATGKKLVLFIDWPELGFDPRSCLPRPVSLFSRPRPLCGVPRAEVDARNRAYREAIAGLKREFPGLRIFDPLPYLCDSSACYAMIGGHLLYRDDNHLSAAGARYLTEKFFEEQSSLPKLNP